jgi:hypothetical protein
MRTPAVFSLLAVWSACSAGGRPPPGRGQPLGRPRHLAPPMITADAGPPVAPPGARGAACTTGESPAGSCAPELLCLPAPGGYCGTSCGALGAPCGDGGVCTPTLRAGELCLAGCSRDADCRADEGYVCDPRWKACTPPGFTALVPRACPGRGGRDPSFGPAAALSTPAGPGRYDLEPAAALLPAGGVVALYIAGAPLGAGNVLGLARSGPGGQVVGQVLDRPFTSTKTNHFDPWLARDRAGALHAVWLGVVGRGAGPEIGHAVSRDDGATWSTPVAVHDPADLPAGDAGDDALDKPMIAIGPGPGGPGERLYVLYAAGEGGLRVRASADGGATFGPTVTALTGIYGHAAVGADGALHVVTINGGPPGGLGSADQQIEYTVSRDGGASFRGAVKVSGRDETLPFFFSNPSLAVDDRRGWLYVAYARGGRDGIWDIVVAASKDHGATWKRTRIGDTPACAIHMVPNLALDPTTGTLHVAWYDTEGGARFAHASCKVGAAACQVAGAISDAPFAILSTVRHGAAWIGEYQALLVDDKRRLLHAVWAQPIDEGGQPISRIFHATARLPAR